MLRIHHEHQIRVYLISSSYPVNFQRIICIPERFLERKGKRKGRRGREKGRELDEENLYATLVE